MEELIDAIGQPVDPASRAAVEAARAAYDALGQKLQARVGNYDVLLAAEARLAELNAQDIYKTTGDFIVSKGAPVTGSIGGEWAGSGPGLFRPGRPRCGRVLRLRGGVCAKGHGRERPSEPLPLHREFPSDPGPDGYG